MFTESTVYITQCLKILGNPQDPELPGNSKDAWRCQNVCKITFGDMYIFFIQLYKKIMYCLSNWFYIKFLGRLLFKVCYICSILPSSTVFNIKVTIFLRMNYINWYSPIKIILVIYWPRNPQSRKITGKCLILEATCILTKQLVLWVFSIRSLKQFLRLIFFFLLCFISGQLILSKCYFCFFREL